MKYSKLALIALGSVSVSLFHAQDSVTVADYKRAESRLFYKTAPLIRNVMNGLIWDKDSKGFKYNKTSSAGELTNVYVTLEKKAKTETPVQTNTKKFQLSNYTTTKEK
ncbi:hypothetical protein [Elizabethkingia anophelis]|uniref:hypothetical protein n=1 Tax=Elizabethkingia anophelis TaxID=1117645 RepID=UPI003786FF3B